MLGRHTPAAQKRKIAITAAAALGLVLVAWIVWPSGSQTPTIAAQNAPGSPQTTLPPHAATTTSTTAKRPTTTTTKAQVGGGGSATPSVAASTGVPTQTAASSAPPVAAPSTTTTTGPSLPPPGTVSYTANVSPNFVQDPTNPLKVTYAFSANASIIEDGQFVPVAVLPAGTLTLFSNLGQICTMSVSGTVTGGTCSTTYPSFASYNIIANYIVNGTTHISPLLTDNVQPFGTTTVAGITGGGSEGGIVFYAAVTDSNGNPVTTGTMSMTVGDATQGWSYAVNATLAPDGAHTEDFGCVFVENFPKVGEYSGCGLEGPYVQTPMSGDELTVTATYAGTAGWSGSSATEVTYSMP